MKKAIAYIIILSIYSLLFYYLQTSQLKSDFATFYSSAQAYAQGTDPYINLIASFLPVPIKLSANLNPPFFLQLLVPLSHFNYHIAASIWFLCSIILGIISALLSFKLLCAKETFKKYWLTFVFIYLGMFSTLMNTGIGQVGGFCSFFIVAGYYFYLRQHDYLAGIFWGFIISLKLFPALLFLFLLNQKRYKVFFIALVCCALAFLIPVWQKGVSIYSIYFNMLPRVAWHGDNWNASLYGFLFRLFIDIHSLHRIWLIKIIYLVLFAIVLFWYIRVIHLLKKASVGDKDDHREFCFTLLIMLFLSPLGWMYYFSLLLMPLVLIWHSLIQEKQRSNKSQALWTVCVLLINFPIGYMQASDMNSFLSRVSIYSINFYGLILIIYLFTRINKSPPLLTLNDINRSDEYTNPVIIALALGILITLCGTIAQLIHAQI